MKLTMKHARKVGLFLGPGLFLIVLFFPTLLLEELSFEARIVLGATLWMAAWWITEAIPIYVTALLPFIIFPSLGVTELQETAASYADRIIFLFLGGFMLAKAMEKSNLHSRFALNILKVFGTNPKYIVAAFMMVIFLLGAWMSNTAITMLMLPVAIAVISQFRSSSASDRERFGLCLMLSVAYSASISGVATLIASPPNAIFASLSEEITGVEVSFSQWMAIGFPIGVISILIAWLYMVNFGVSIRGIKPITGEKRVIETKLSELGSITRNEKLVLGVFVATALAWVTRGLLWGQFVPTIDDSAIAVAAIFLLFVLPSSSFRREKTRLKQNEQVNEYQKNIIESTSRIDISISKKTNDRGVDAENEEQKENKKGDRLLDWKSAAQIPWEVLLLIGGGIALANAFIATGLDDLVAEQLIFLEGMNHIITILIIVAVTAVVGEVISNTATAALMIPISASLATSLDVNPILFMVPVTIVTSFSFMMPVSTPPNTIVFASGYVTTSSMVRAGLPLKIIGIAIVTILTIILVPLIWK